MQDRILFGGDVYFPAFGAYFCDSADNEVANLWFVATCQRREDTRGKMLSGLSGYRDLSGLTDRSLFTRWTVPATDAITLSSSPTYVPCPLNNQSVFSGMWI